MNVKLIGLAAVPSLLLALAGCATPPENGQVAASHGAGVDCPTGTRICRDRTATTDTISGDTLRNQGMSSMGTTTQTTAPGGGR
jgi:hypothetical protein